MGEMKCKHKWKLIDKTLIESPFTKLVNQGREIKVDSVGASFSRDRLIYVFQCELCFEVKIKER